MRSLHQTTRLSYSQPTERFGVTRRKVITMMKSVHHIIDFTEVAHRRCWRDNGEEAAMPACGYEAAEHDGKSFVVVSNTDGPLAIYRIDFGKRDGLMAATNREAVAVSKLLGYLQ